MIFEQDAYLYASMIFERDANLYASMIFERDAYLCAYIYLNKNSTIEEERYRGGPVKKPVPTLTVDVVLMCVMSSLLTAYLPAMVIRERPLLN
jgi:hypothetical protein